MIWFWPFLVLPNNHFYWLVLPLSVNLRCYDVIVNILKKTLQFSISATGGSVWAIFSSKLIFIPHDSKKLMKSRTSKTLDNGFLVSLLEQNRPLFKLWPRHFLIRILIRKNYVMWLINPWTDPQTSTRAKKFFQVKCH